MLGKVAGGSQRWLDLGIIRSPAVRADEAARSCSPARASTTCCRRNETRRFGAIWPAALLIGLPAALVMLQPDLGTALMIGAGGVDGDVPRRRAAAAVRRRRAGARGRGAARGQFRAPRLSAQPHPRSSSIPKAIRSAPAITSASRRSRSDRAASVGKGFLNGTQSHLDYLPEGHTDFVFATMAEEWGLVGGVLLILAFCWSIRWGSTSASAPRPASPG